MKKLTRRIITLGVSAVCTVALLTAVAAETSVDQLMSIFRNTDRSLLGSYAVLSFAALLIRAFRYRLLFEAFGSQDSNPRQYKFSDMAAITAIRNAVVDMVPGRAGEVLTIYFFKQISVPIITAGHSIVALFILDAAILSFLVALVGVFSIFIFGGVFPDPATGAAPASHLIILLAAIPLCVAAFWLFYRLDSVVSVIARRFFPRHTAGPVQHPVLVRFCQDYSALRSSGRLVPLAGATFILRLLKYSSLYLLLLAVVAQWGLSPADISFPAAFVSFVAAEGVATLPASGLFGFGAYEGVWGVVFSYLGLKSVPVFSVIFAVHIITQVVALFLSLIGFGWISRPVVGEHRKVLK